MKHLPLYAIVSISGAAVLALEILGTRVLGPFYGVSIFLWSALITVTLAALAVGYALGGRWADKGPTYSRLAFLLALAALWILMMPMIRRPLLQITQPLGLRAAVLTASFLMFFLPLLLLGMVSPYAIRLKAASLDQVGRTAGNLYAISTLASVAAALLTGFVLIPHVGVNRLILLVGALLLVAAAISWSVRRPASAASVLMLLGGPLLATGFWHGAAERADLDSGLMAIRQSDYAEVRVVNIGEDEDEERLLLIDGGMHSRVRPGTWDSTIGYVVVIDLAKHLFAKPGKMLLVGLGAGSVAKSFHRDGWDVDAVEIDPIVTAMAHRYFGFDDRDARVFATDGRRYLATTTTKYDLIVIDAFGSSSIPFHLVTREAFKEITDHLTPSGVLAINVEIAGWNDPLVGALARTMGAYLDNIHALPTGEPPNALGNIVILASRRDVSFPEEELGNPYDFLPEPYMHWVVVQRNHAWNNRFIPSTAGSQILTDDVNPVDLWAENVNQMARKDLHLQFKDHQGLSW